MFSTEYSTIQNYLNNIDPIKYGQNRNYIDGDITRLSPYISRGVISTKQILTSLIAKGYKFSDIESFVQELAWRDYFQRVHQNLGNLIFQDIKQPQNQCVSKHIPVQVLNATTGIHAIDEAIHNLYNLGYVHNHFRMYTAMLVTNIAQTHWFQPAQWYYYHLLDADIASNTLSWQWVSGCFSSKKYYANQENINKYYRHNQSNTFLDKTYEAIMKMDIPHNLINRDENLKLITHLPKKTEIKLTPHIPTLIYNFYNVDPLWHSELEANRILLLEPSSFQRFPISDASLQFLIQLSKNIQNIQIYTGEFSELATEMESTKFIFKEHPLNINYQGIVESRDWMCENTSGYFPSFFKYWKNIEASIKYLF